MKSNICDPNFTYLARREEQRRNVHHQCTMRTGRDFVNLTVLFKNGSALTLLGAWASARRDRMGSAEHGGHIG